MEFRSWRILKWLLHSSGNSGRWVRGFRLLAIFGSPVRERSRCRREIRSEEDRRKDQERGECRSLGLSSRRRLLGATLVPRGRLGRASFVWRFPYLSHPLFVFLSIRSLTFLVYPRLSSRMQRSGSTHAANEQELKSSSSHHRVYYSFLFIPPN